jgi:hypothetical protein
MQHYAFDFWKCFFPASLIHRYTIFYLFILSFVKSLGEICYLKIMFNFLIP